MSNPFSELRSQIAVETERFDIVHVVSSVNDKLTVQTEEGIIKTVWGKATSGDYVIIQGKTVLGRVSDETTIIVYVP